MVKLPESGVTDPRLLEQRTQLLHDFGAFLSMWGEFELALELAISKRAKLTAIDASIILGGLQFGAKSSILFSLLHEHGAGPEIAKAVTTTVIDEAKRNALVHGYANFEVGEDALFAFSKREVRRSYKVTHSEFTSDQFHEHLLRLQTLMGAAFNALKITADDVTVYANAARLLAPTTQPPQSLRPGEETD